MSRFVYIRPMANGQAFPSGIHDTETKENIFLDKDIIKVKEYLEKVCSKEEENKTSNCYLHRCWTKLKNRIEIKKVENRNEEGLLFVVQRNDELNKVLQIMKELEENI